MDNIIRDPQRGNAASVLLNSIINQGLLRTFSSIEEYGRHINKHYQEAYSLIIDNITPTGADDCFCYMQNEKDQNMIIESILLKKFTADDEVYIILGATGTRDTVTAIYPGNKYAGSSHEAVGTFEQGADLAGGGATITAASGQEIDRINIINTHESKLYKFSAGLIIPKYQTLTLWAGTGANALNVTVNFFYDML